MHGAEWTGCEIIIQARIARTSRRSIWISASRDGIRRQEESSGSGVVGTKSNSKARSSGYGCLGR